LLSDPRANYLECDSNKVNAVHLAARRGKQNSLELLLKSQVFSIDAQTVKREKDGLTDHHAKDQTALHMACEKGHIEAVRLLLEYNADCTITDASRKTADALAAENGLGLS
jgi:ankyrin repeat protein